MRSRNAIRTIVSSTLLTAAGVAGCGAPEVGDTTGVVAAPPAASAAPAGAPPGGAADGEMQPVRLAEMESERSDPEPERRNPFRFGEARVEFDPGEESDDDPFEFPDFEDDDELPDVPAARGAPSGPRGAPLPLSFLGFVESSGLAGRIVVLTDGEYVFHGREGDIIDGRYRIVGTGLESVDIERIDGSSAETLTLPES